MAPRILLIHPGHSFSTSDVYDGLAWGLRWAGAEVLEYRWDEHLEGLRKLTAAVAASGVIAEDKGEDLLTFAAYLASADSFEAAYAGQVDAVLVVNGLLFPAVRAAALRRLGIPVACYGTEAPYMEGAERGLAPAYSHWFTQERKSVQRYQDLAPTTYLPLAYHPERHCLGPVDPERAVDAVFVGGGYPERKRLLDGVNWSGLRHARVGTLWSIDLAAEAAKSARPGRQANYSEGNVPNEVTTAWHRSAKIALNIHRRMTYIETLGQIEADEAESCNPRVYEVPAVGGFLLSDDSRPEQRELFPEIPTYRYGDSADLERQVRYWLANDHRRESQALAQHEAVAEHHYGQRARTVLETLIP